MDAVNLGTGAVNCEVESNPANMNHMKGQQKGTHVRAEQLT